MEKLKDNIKKIFSVGPKSTFVVILLIIICFCVILSMKKRITVVIDGKQTEIVTFSSDVKSSLKKNNINVGPKDKVVPALNSKVKNGEKIYIKRAVKIQVAVDGKELKVATAESNVGGMLKAEGITVSNYDKITPLKTESIESGMEITIVRVSSEIIRDYKSLDFPTETRNDDTMASNVTKVVQEGQAGKREIISKVVYEDGKEVSRQVVSDSVTMNPIRRIILQGTLGILNLSRGGDPILYKKVINVKATAYCPCYICTGKYRGDDGYALTASGTIAKRNPNGYSTIAVDPRIIPLGTKVYVEGYGYAIAEDTGGAIKGNRIDLFYNSHSEALDWGVKNINIYILK